MQAKLKVELLTHTPNPDSIVAMGGKLCYSPVGIDGIKEKLTDEEIKKFVNILVEMGHGSPLEHAVFTFGIEGVSRSLTHQLVRHRLASYSQKSQRYVREGQFQYVIPKEIESDDVARRLFIEHMVNTQRAYDTLINRLLDEFSLKELTDSGYDIDYNKSFGENLMLANKKKYNELEKLAIENARAVLPNACETKIIVTMNARNLIHFFNKRSCNRAQEEIRGLSDEMLRLVREVAPALFKFAGADCTYGKCGEVAMSCKQPRLDLRVE